jgi:hypothetical protein
MNSKHLGLLALVFVIASPKVASAQTETLGYGGSAFTSLTINGNLSIGLQNMIPANTGELVLSSPLGDNLHNAAITPVSWSFDATAPFGGYLDSNGPTAGGPGQSASFVFSTDASGALTGWNINILGGILSGTNSPSFAAITLGNAGDSYSAGFSSPSCAALPGVVTGCFTIAESNNASGSWSSTITRVPEIDSASAAGGLTLLFGSLAVLLSRRKNSRASRLTYGCAPTHRA